MFLSFCSIGVSSWLEATDTELEMVAETHQQVTDSKLAIKTSSWSKFKFTSKGSLHKHDYFIKLFL